MEEDYRSASRKFWQNIQRPRNGKDIVGWWKKYFEDLLNPTDTSFIEVAEAGDSEVDSFITQAEVTEVVRNLVSGRAPGVDEIHPPTLSNSRLWMLWG